MPFDCTEPERWNPGPDPAPTWGERIAAWVFLAVLVALNAVALSLIALWSLGAVALGLAGNATAAVSLVWAAAFSWAGWHALHAAHAEACAVPATAFEVGKQMLCGGHARDLVVALLTAVSPLFALVVAVGIGAARDRARRD